MNFGSIDVEVRWGNEPPLAGQLNTITVGVHAAFDNSQSRVSTYVDASNNNADSNEYVEYFSFPSKPTWFIAGLPAEHEMVGELRVRKAHVKKLKHYEKILKASMMLSTLDMVDSPEFYIDAEEAN